MISIKEIEKLHKILIDNFGGSHGIRDYGLLQSALSRPYQTFDNHELYPTVLEKAASLIESILTNHPFVDGNKRTGYTLLRCFLIHHGTDINATEEEKYQFVINIASGNARFDDIVKWLQVHIQK